MRYTRPGTTLIELLVVLVILAVTAGIAGLAAGSARGSAEDQEVSALVDSARREAISSGRAVRVRILLRREGPASGSGTDPLVALVTALPDGAVLAPPDAAISRLVGRPRRRSVER